MPHFNREDSPLGEERQAIIQNCGIAPKRWLCPFRRAGPQGSPFAFPRTEHRGQAASRPNGWLCFFESCVNRGHGGRIGIGVGDCEPLVVSASSVPSRQRLSGLARLWRKLRALLRDLHSVSFWFTLASSASGAERTRLHRLESKLRVRSLSFRRAQFAGASIPLVGDRGASGPPPGQNKCVILPPAPSRAALASHSLDFARNFPTRFLPVPTLRRWGSSRTVVHYEQAGKRRGDLPTGDRGHRSGILG
jgi:hypothetical protein